VYPFSRFSYTPKILAVPEGRPNRVHGVEKLQALARLGKALAGFPKVRSRKSQLLKT